MITLGEDGSVVKGSGEIAYTPCMRMPEVRDPTAAGDFFVAAFCTGQAAGLPRKQALAFAAHAAITVPDETAHRGGGTGPSAGAKVHRV